MATVPSVVIGFLVALWLAPILESWLFAFFLSLIAVPAAFVVFMIALADRAAVRLGEADGERLRVSGGAAGAAGGRRHRGVFGGAAGERAVRWRTSSPDVASSNRNR